MALLNLFLAFFRIGSFAIGGAYSFLPLIEREVVEKYHWLAKDEFLDMLGLANIFPGAISVKFATYTGYKVAGVPGVIVANLGNIFTPAILTIFVFGLFAKYKDLPQVHKAFNIIQLVVFAMIIAIAFQLINVGQIMHLRSLLIVVVSFVLFVYAKIHPAILIIAAGIIGAFLK